MGFEPCVGCRRHVKAGTSGCPFCGATVCTTSKARLLGRVSRAAVFASATSACWTGNGPATDTTTVSNKVEASATSGIITGRVVDATNNRKMAGVVVEIYPVTGGDPKRVTTDSSGRYRVADLPAGDYQVIFRGPQQNPRMAPYPNNVKVAAGQTVTLDNAYQPYDPSNIPMPYGAPPARRRVV